MKVLVSMRKKVKDISSGTGNRTLVSRVTGGDTSHYTIPDLYVALSLSDHYHLL